MTPTSRTTTDQLGPYADWARLVRRCRTRTGFGVAGPTGLAAKLQVSRETIYRWEAGTSRPRPTDEALERFCGLFQVPLAEAWAAIGYEGPAAVEYQPTDPLFIEMVEFLRSPRRSPAAKAHLRRVISEQLAYLREQEADIPAPRQRRRTA